ncbi:MAG: HEAT repeat domain-containing protein [Planctomycetota bacterium]
MIKNKQSASAIGSCLLCAICCWLMVNSGLGILADAIYLKNGSTIEGKIISEDKKSVTLEVGFGTITINRSQIYQVIAEEWKPSDSKPPQVPLPEKPITVTKTVTPATPTSPSNIALLLDAKAQTPLQKDINQFLIKLIESSGENDSEPIMEEMIVKSEKDKDYFLLLLNDISDVKVLKWVIEVLGRHNFAKAIKPLFEILTGDDESLKLAVLDAFTRMKEVSTIHLIRNQLPKEKSPTVKMALINRLISAADKESLPLFLEYLDDDDGGVRKTSADAIINITGKLTADELKSFDLFNRLRDKMSLVKNNDTRKEIINIFGRLQNPEAVNTLMDLLLDENTEIRSEAAMALADIGDKKTTNFLIDRLSKEQDNWTKMQIIGAIQKINDTATIPALIEALRDDDEKVRTCAARALRNLTPCAFGEDYEKWKEWWEKEQEK